MLSLNQVSLVRGNKPLFKPSSFTLYEKQKVGLVGQNGCGKSSLFKLILAELPSDAGELHLNRHLRISHLAQTVPETEELAIDFVLAGDDLYMDLLHRLKKAEASGQDDVVVECHEALNQTGGYAKPALAASILSGLGFKEEETRLPVSHFSGGWQMRLNLARCLMKPAELLLLDEPTNHLDMEAIFWLERWLKQSAATLVIISHDRDFLDSVVSHILHIEHQTISLYTGNYSQFEKTRAEKLALQQAMHEKQQKKLDHMMSYVERFRAKASKAKQAQSRLKAIEKMDVIARAHIDSPFTFEFFESPKSNKAIISCDDVNAGYFADNPILSKVNLEIQPGDRIGLLGPNGQGKSTLIKTLTGEILPLSGTITTSKHQKIGYFAQHQMKQLDVDLSPLQTIQALTPRASEQSIRNFLGGFNFIGDMATEPCQYFSGGEKARLVLASLVWQKPNLLLLDEPTNHLDLEMRAALEMALQAYDGALILISHDRHFLRMTVNNFYLVHNHRVQPFDGGVDEYHLWLDKKDSNLQVTEKKQDKTLGYKERKSLQNQLKKIERSMELIRQEKEGIDQKLSDPALYEAPNQLEALLIERDKLQSQLDKAEEQWIDILEQLELT